MVSILAAQVPAQPSAPTTTWSPDNVVITWTAPDNGGSAITGYTVKIRQSDDTTFTVDSANCDMSSSTQTTCTVPVTALRASPYSLEWGTNVHATVIAINAYGNSVESAAGNGAVITTTPGAPTALVEVTAERTKSTLGLSWTAPTFTGGAVIDDYRINIAEQGGSYSVAAASVSGTTYTLTGLTAGTTYEIKVEAQNSYGYSAYSSVLTLLCAFVPDSPTTITTANVNAAVSITWSEPVTNGSPITAYKILIQQKDSAFTEETVECVGSSAGVISGRTCSIALATLKASPYLLVKGDSVVA